MNSVTQPLLRRSAVWRSVIFASILTILLGAALVSTASAQEAGGGETAGDNEQTPPYPSPTPVGDTGNGGGETTTEAGDPTDQQRTGPTITMTGPQQPVLEGNGFAFILTANPAPTARLPINVGITQGRSYLTGTVVDELAFGPGDSQIYWIMSTAENTYENSDRTVTGAVQSGTGYTVGTPSTASFTVADDDAPPAAPGNLRLTNWGRSSATVAWDASTGAATYQVEQWNSATGSWDDAGSETASTSKFILGLTCERDLYFRVKAKGNGTTHGATFGPTSDVLDFELPCMSKIKVEAVDASVDEGQNAVFRFTADPAPLLVTDVVTVNISVTEVGDYLTGTLPTRVVFNGRTSTVTLSLPTEDDAVDEIHGIVTVRITSISRSTSANQARSYAIGTPSSATVSIWDDDNTPLPETAAPRNLRLTWWAPRSATLAWDAVTGAADYTVELKEGVFGLWDEEAEDIAGTSKFLPGLACDTQLYFRVAAEGNGTTHASTLGAWSSALTFELPCDPEITVTAATTPVEEGEDAEFIFTADPAPLLSTDVVTVTFSTTAVGNYLSWTAPTQVVFNGKTSSVRLPMATDDDTTYELDGSVTVRVTGISRAQRDAETRSYQFGTPRSATVVIEDNDASTPAAPGNLRLTWWAPRSATLEWDAVTGAADYTVELKEGVFGLWNEEAEDIVGTSKLLPGLTCDEQLYFRVKARGNGTTHAAKLGDPSDVLDFELPCDPTVTVEAVTTPVEEGEDAEFLFTADPAPLLSTDVVTVTFSTTTAGNYLLGTAPTRVVFNGRTSSVRLPLPTDDDTMYELDGSVTARITGISRSQRDAETRSYQFGTPRSATVIIKDNEPAPEPPENLRFTDWTTHSATLAWDASTGAAEYKVQLKEGVFGLWADEATGITGTSKLLPAQTCGTELYFRVLAKGNGTTHKPAYGDPSDVLDFNLPCDLTITVEAVNATIEEGEAAEFTFTAHPAPLLATDVVTVTFTITEEGDFLTGILPTQVVFTGTTETVPLSLPTEDDGVYELDGSVTVRIDHVVRTRSTNQARTYQTGTPRSATVTILDNKPAPEPPANLRLTNWGTSTATVAWDVVTGAATYQVQVREGFFGTWTDTGSENASLSKVLLALSCDTDLYVRVKARGNGTTHKPAFGDPSDELRLRLPCILEITVEAVATPVEEGEDAAFLFRANPPPLLATDVVTVTIANTTVGDYLAGTVPTQVVFTGTTSTVTLSLPTNDDAIPEDDGSVTVRITGISRTLNPSQARSYQIATMDEATVVIEDNDDGFRFSPNPLDLGGRSDVWEVPADVTDVYVDVSYAAGSANESGAGGINVQRVDATDAVLGATAIDGEGDSGTVAGATGGSLIRLEVDKDAFDSNAALVTLTFHSGTDPTGPVLAQGWVQQEARPSAPVNGSAVVNETAGIVKLTWASGATLTGAAPDHYEVVVPDPNDAMNPQYANRAVDDATDPAQLVIEHIDELGAGSHTAEVRHCNAIGGCSAALSLAFTLLAPVDRMPTFDMATVADQNWNVGAAITTLDLPNALGGNGTLTYRLTPALPSGLTFSATNRTITGTPAAEITATEYTYAATDSDTTSPDAASLTFDITVSVAGDLTPVFNTPIPDQTYTVGQDIPTLYLPAATGGNGTLRYSLTPPLPSGLTFSSTERTITGTPTAIASATEYTYTATDADATNPDTAMLTFDITVVSGDLTPVFSTPIPDQTLTVGQAISTLTLPAATGGDGTLTYMLNPALPSGLTFSATARTITGTPSAATAATVYTYTATDADATNPDTASLILIITVVGDLTPVFGTTVPDQTYTVGQAITTLDLPQATGGNGTLTYSLTPALPRGLTFSDTAQTITGTPTVVATATEYTYTATDADAVTPDAVFLTFAITVAVTGDLTPTFGMETVADQTYTADQAITIFTLPAATGGNGTLTYSLAPALPGGLTFNAVARTISGTPTAAASATAYTYTARDADATNPDSTSRAFTITVTSGTLVTPLADAVEEFSGVADNASGTLTLTWDVDDNPGYQIRYWDFGGGGWTPIEDGPYTLICGATAASICPAGSTSAVVSGLTADPRFLFMEIRGHNGVQHADSGDRRTFSFRVLDDLGPRFIDTVADQTYVTGDLIDPVRMPVAAGGNGNLTYSISPELPAGLSFDPVSRYISGTPAAASSATTYTFTATDADASQPDSATQILSIEVAIPTNNTPVFNAILPEYPIGETTAVGTAVATITATDQDASDTVTYSLPTGTNTVGGFAIDPMRGAITLTSGLDYEVQRLYLLRVEASDGRGGNAFKIVTIKVTDVNEASITPPSSPVREGGNLIFTVALDQAVANDVTVTVGLSAESTALPGAAFDFSISSLNASREVLVTVASNTTSTDIIVNTHTDTSGNETYETVVLNVTSVSDSAIVIDAGGRAKAIGEIADQHNIGSVPNDGSVASREFTVGSQSTSKLEFKLQTCCRVVPFDNNFYKGRAYLIQVEAQQTGNTDWIPATILNTKANSTGAVDTLTEDLPDYADLGIGRAAWVADSVAPPPYQYMLLSVESPFATGTTVYRVTFLKPDLAIVKPPALLPVDQTAPGAIQQEFTVTIRNSSTRGSSEFDAYFASFCFESSGRRSDGTIDEFDTIRGSQDSDLVGSYGQVVVQLSTICLGGGFDVSDSVLLHVELRIGSSSQWVRPSSAPWPFNFNTLWHPHRTVIGGLQMFANPNLRCTVSFPVHIIPIGTSGPGTGALSTTYHCVSKPGDNDAWKQGTVPENWTGNIDLGNKFLAPGFVSGAPPIVSFVLPRDCMLLDEDGNDVSDDSCRPGDHAYSTGGTFVPSPSIFKPRMRNSSNPVSNRSLNYFAEHQLQSFLVVGARPPQMNDTVHKVGRTTGWTSGNVEQFVLNFDDGGKNPCPGDELGTGDNLAATYALECLVAAIYGNVGGDSGAPVFVLADDFATPSVTEVLLVGINFAVRGETAFFIPIDRVYQEALLMGYDWATASFRPIPALDHSLERLELDGTEDHIVAKFIDDDFGHAADIVYRASLFFVDSQGELSQVLHATTGNPLAVEVSYESPSAVFPLSSIPSSHAGMELRAKVELCVQYGTNGELEACSDFGSDGVERVTVP